MSDDDRDVRDRLIRLEEQGKQHKEQIATVFRMLWGMASLVLAFVGNKVLALLNLGGQ
jgi:hypothetical protein